MNRVKRWLARGAASARNRYPLLCLGLEVAILMACAWIVARQYP